MTEEVSHTPLEIAAFNKNTKAFDLLSPHYEVDTKKQIAQLLIWALTDKAPSPAFILLFESVPLAEVEFWTNEKSIKRQTQVNSRTIFEFRLIEALAYEGRTAHVAFLLEQG